MGVTRPAPLADPIRLAAAAVVAAVAASLALLAAAIARFPGGSDADAAARGFDPWFNYLSDLLHDVARDGRPNPAAPLARAAVLAFVAALPPFWALLARLVPAGASLLRVLGTLSAAGWAAVPLVPSDRFGAWHGVFVLVGAGSGLAAAVLGVAGLRRDHPRLAWLGAGVLACVAAAVLFYARLLVGDATAPSLVIPALQKAAGALLVAWIVGVAISAGRGRRPAPSPRPRVASGDRRA